MDVDKRNKELEKDNYGGILKSRGMKMRMKEAIKAMKIKNNDQLMKEKKVTG